MYRLLIVEDEPIEREALKLMILNHCENTFQVEEAENGFAAIKKAEAFMPDIVMVDINMPGINGLDTIRELKKQKAELRFLILSSYNRFEYAQEAMQLGVEDFILKPAKIANIAKSLEAVCEKIQSEHRNREQNSLLMTRLDEMKPIVESDCIYALVGGKSPEEIEKMVSLLDYKVESGFCFVVNYKQSQRYILRKIKQALQEVGVNCIGEQFHNLLVFFVLGSNQLEARKVTEVGRFITMLLSELDKKECHVGMGTIQTRTMELDASYKQALRALEICTEQNLPMFLYGEKEPGRVEKKKQLSDFCEEVTSALQKNEEELKRAILDICTEIILRADSLGSAKQNVYQLIFLVFEQIKKKYHALEYVLDLGLSMEDLMKIENNKELEFYLTIQFNSVWKAIKQYKKVNYSLIINQAMEYMEVHFHENIMLEHVSDALGISSFYLSKLLKKSTGSNFTELLSAKRVEKAKELLKGNWSMKEITFMVGFNSQNYFTKIFKKYVGVTPTEYRNQ